MSCSPMPSLLSLQQFLPCHNSKLLGVFRKGALNVEIIVEDGIEGTIWHRKYNTLQCYNSLWLTTDVVATYLYYIIATCISITDIVNTKDIKCPTPTGCLISNESFLGVALPINRWRRGCSRLDLNLLFAMFRPSFARSYKSF